MAKPAQPASNGPPRRLLGFALLDPLRRLFAVDQRDRGAFTGLRLVESLFMKEDQKTALRQEFDRRAAVALRDYSA